ncbi:MAG TPA: S1/P1 nuclease [Pirellula sp.]|nr:S1/P1 nuclease [Pirellula sp.]
MEHVAHEGLIRKVVGGHFATCRSIGRLDIDNKTEAYNLPQGVICQLYRILQRAAQIASFTSAWGLFVDPCHGGGRLNARSQDSLVERVELGGRQWLWYKSFPIHVALIRAWGAEPKYHRSTWHYELGPTLVIGDPSNMKVPARPGPLPIDATLETQSLHIAQALTLCGKTLADAKQPESDRAVALCWIAHLVADTHQPCHAGSLYMEKVFVEEDGDRGANRILTKQRKNMHALWDQLLGDKFTLNGNRKRILEITTDGELVAKSKQAITVNNGLDPLTWLSESRSSAISNVYTAEVMDSLNLVSRGVTAKPEAIELSEAYLKNAGRVAQVRAIEASRRLAETWRVAIK